jgi:hypothetical protein
VTAQPIQEKAPTDREFEVLMLEYEKLKDESTERIKARDNFVYLNVASIGLLASFTGTAPSRAIAYLAVPWICLGFGWTYLMNDEKISALAKYTRYGLRPRLGGPSFGWEDTPKRRTKLKRLHKWGQFLVDILMFVAPTPASLAAYLAFTKTTPIGVFVVMAIELTLTLAMFLMMLAHSPITSRWDVPPSQWNNPGGN